MKTKNLIANFLMAVTLLTGSVTFASANTASMANGKAAKPSETASSMRLFTVSGNMVRYHTYNMAAGEQVQIVLSGDGDTDLDLYVYDSAGRLIDSRESYADNEVSTITAYRPGTITIKVVNRGSYYNQYDLSVWSV